MQKKIPYDIVVRRLATGEEHARLIFAADESIARERAMVRARHALGATFVEREYGESRRTVFPTAAVRRRG